ncbi:MAG: bifunctional DNA-formamidopyrimidine glycosylase/DNA-(apurinic or apyrimidinic site) lyase [Bowdeniella nasicola]|nr:bifunctional DNA-formamidopyrimidine glycosylase/DNA-(apurinic or apyrimidinic site) lyase [Bowdeniella nasicola]
MPELPEVETVRRGLAQHLTGATITDIAHCHPRAIRLQPGGEAGWRAIANGGQVTAWVRRGKYLWALIDNAHAAISFHLRMSGQILLNPRADTPTRHRRAVLRFGSANRETTLWFMDQRTFGYLLAEELVASADGAPGGCGSNRPYLPRSVAHIGRDALDPYLDADAIIARWAASSSPIKALLLRQDICSGIGNIYADEALWHARIHPATPGRELTALQHSLLLGAAGRVMGAATAAGGTSFDALYVDVSGASGWFGRELVAYGLAGQPCRRCATPLERSKVAGRASTWCPKCTPPPAAPMDMAAKARNIR